MAKPERITDRKLLNGWAATAGTRIRAATDADIAAIGPLADLAGAPFEPELQAGIANGEAGAGLRVGLRNGHRAYMQYMAARFTERQHAQPILAYLYAALVLVAEHRDNGIVGAVIAYPPLTAAADIVYWMEQAGYDERERYKTVLGTGMFLARIKAVAVAEHARGTNLGGSLLKRVKQVYDQLHYEVIYGAMPEGRGLDAFYRRAGFTVHESGEPLDLFTLYGRDTKISPGPNERIFSRHRPADGGR